ncbi:MAG: glycosyltransferase family 2 protein [Sporichthyaceae bacterium]
MTILDHAPDYRTSVQSTTASTTLPELQRDVPAQTVLDAVRGMLQEALGRALPTSDALSLPGGLSALATAARVPTQIPYQLASLVIGVPLAFADDPWAVGALRSWVRAEVLDRLRVVPVHFDGAALHYATPDVPTRMQAAAVVAAFGVPAARPMLCTPEDLGAWSLPPDPSRRAARPVLENALTGSAVWMASLRRLPLPPSLVEPLGAAVGAGATTAVVAGDPRALEVLAPLASRLTGLPVAHAEVAPDVREWLAVGADPTRAPTPPELLEQLREISAPLRGMGWHAALAGLPGEQRVRLAAWALGVPWLGAELSALVAGRWPAAARAAFVDPDWAGCPPRREEPVGRRVVVGTPPTTTETDALGTGYAEALLTLPLAAALAADDAADALSLVSGGMSLDEALAEVDPGLAVSDLLARHVGSTVLDLDPRPHRETRIDAFGRPCETARWDDPLEPTEHGVLAEPGVVPVGHDASGALVVAVADPLSPGLRERLAELTDEPVHVAVASREQVGRARRRLLARRSLEASTLDSELSTGQWNRARLHSRQWKVSTAQAALDLGLTTGTADAAERTRPDRVARLPQDSARQFMTPGQKAVAATGALVLGMALLLAPSRTLAAAVAVALVLLLASGAYRAWEAARTGRQPADTCFAVESPPAALPVITVLIPLSGRRNAMPVLLERLAEFDYPADRLDVKLLVDQGDPRTHRALAAMTLPEFAEVLTVPHAGVSGRFKAANFGLLHARGPYVVLHDPAARPARNLLREAARAFEASPAEVVCLQAGLRQRNYAPHLLGRLFSRGYAMTFGGLFALRTRCQPIPLGPTSTFLRTDWLRSAGGWDPHNRTAQADLGVRIRRLGVRAAALEATVDQPMEASVRGWVRRCARCVAGYTQTWLVHMRQPRELLDDLGVRGFVGFQCAIFGTVLAFLAFPVLWALAGLWALGADWAGALFLGPPQVALSLLGVSSALFLFGHLLLSRVGPEGAGWRLVFSPWYWSLRTGRVRSSVRRLAPRQAR